MFDHNWELVSGTDAHEIEVLNQANQVNVIEAMFYLFKHQQPIDPAVGCTVTPSAAAIREVHRTGTLFLLHKPGEYREVPVHLSNGAAVVYNPPHHEQVKDLVEDFVVELKNTWLTRSPVEVASFCLWRLNWIHPFKNGNGRTARAIAYACLTLKLGFILPGSPTVVDLIMQNKPEFEAALRHADVTLADAGVADLSPMNTFVTRLLTEQLASVPPPPATP